jgi:hypothetical protein
LFNGTRTIGAYNAWLRGDKNFREQANPGSQY